MSSVIACNSLSCESILRASISIRGADRGTAAFLDKVATSQNGSIDFVANGLIRGSVSLRIRAGGWVLWQHMFCQNINVEFSVNINTLLTDKCPISILHLKLSD